MSVQQLLALVLTLVVFSCVVMPPPASAQVHVVDLFDLQHELQLSHETRTANLADIERVLSLPAAQQALAKTSLDRSRVTAAIAELDDQELAHLATRARAAEQDVEGGFIIGLLALIGLIVVVVVVISIRNSNE